MYLLMVNSGIGAFNTSASTVLPTTRAELLSMLSAGLWITAWISLHLRLWKNALRLAARSSWIIISLVSALADLTDLACH